VSFSDCFSFTAKEKQGKTTRHFKVTTAVNINITNLRIVKPRSFVQAYERFGGISPHHNFCRSNKFRRSKGKNEGNCEQNMRKTEADKIKENSQEKRRHW
jgi:hypothetical protein